MKSTDTSYLVAVSSLPKTFATDEVITEMHTSKIRFIQSSSIFSTKYAKALWNKVLLCVTINSEYVFKRILIL